MDTSSSVAAKTGQEILITRIFDAPRELVFKAWAEPEQWVHWLGLRGVTGKVLQTARRAGDAYRYYMRDPQGGDHWLQGVYRELVEPERMAFTWGFVNEHGQPTSPETIVALTFEDVGGKTRLTLRHGIFETATSCDAHRRGWTDSFDRLAEFVQVANA
jgi:uncharacterized protein YndB with AHSA1/START domain